MSREAHYDAIDSGGYNNSSATSATKSSPELTDDEKEYLNQFRRCRFY